MTAEPTPESLPVYDAVQHVEAAIVDLEDALLDRLLTDEGDDPGDPADAIPLADVKAELGL